MILQFLSKSEESATKFKCMPSFVFYLIYIIVLFYKFIIEMIRKFWDTINKVIIINLVLIMS